MAQISTTLWSLLKPWFFMAISVWYFLITIIQLVSAGDLATMTSRDALIETWFGNFWKFMGPLAKKEAERYVAPLLEGRVQKGCIRETNGDGRPIEGTVIEVGAGSGMWTDVFAKVSSARRTRSGVSGPSKIYGVEPNPISAAALRCRVDEVGLAGTYEVVPVGIQDLEKEASIKPGSVDCIVTLHCLCSIPDPEKNIQMLYDYLKEGGRWYLYEHVRAERGLFVPLFQRKYSRLLGRSLRG